MAELDVCCIKNLIFCSRFGAQIDRWLVTHTNNLISYICSCEIRSITCKWWNSDLYFKLINHMLLCIITKWSLINLELLNYAMILSSTYPLPSFQPPPPLNRSLFMKKKFSTNQIKILPMFPCLLQTRFYYYLATNPPPPYLHLHPSRLEPPWKGLLS